MLFYRKVNEINFKKFYWEIIKLVFVVSAIGLMFDWYYKLLTGYKMGIIQLMFLLIFTFLVLLYIVNKLYIRINKKV